MLDYTSTRKRRRRLNDGWKMSQEPVNQDSWRPAGIIRGDASRCGEVGDDPTPSLQPCSSDETEQPRLELSYLARRAGLLDGSPSAVPFALLASIRDNSGRGDLHDRVRTQFPVLTRLPRNRALIPAMRAQV